VRKQYAVTNFTFSFLAEWFLRFPAWLRWKVLFFMEKGRGLIRCSREKRLWWGVGI
jgi:hypothetical protein